MLTSLSPYALSLPPSTPPPFSLSLPLCLSVSLSLSLSLPLYLSLPPSLLHPPTRPLQAEREPILSSFLYASILAHSCFERSLGFVLANRLNNVTLLATQLMDVFDDVLQQPAIRAAIRADVQAVRDRDPSCKSYSCALLYYKVRAAAVAAAAAAV